MLGGLLNLFLYIDPGSGTAIGGSIVLLLLIAGLIGVAAFVGLIWVIVKLVRRFNK